MRHFNLRAAFKAAVLCTHKNAASLVLEQDCNAQDDKAHPFTSTHSVLPIPSSSALPQVCFVPQDWDGSA